MKKLVVLISNTGTGSNLQAIISAIKSHEINMKLTAVLSDTKEAAGLKHAKKNKIPIVICQDKKLLLNKVSNLNPDYIALSGWKQIILKEVIDAYPKKILNLHPGLIPDQLTTHVYAPDGTKALWNRGLLTDKAINNFLNKKASYAGSTVHFLTHEFDFGPVLARAFIKIKGNDTTQKLYSRLKKKEHQIYVKVLKNLASQTKVLIIDGGGRGSVLAQAYSNSRNVSDVFVLPGNDYIEYVQQITTFQNIKVTDTQKIIHIAKKHNIDLVDVTQDDAIAAGLVDKLHKIEISVFGPSKKAGQIEWDKAWSRNFMKKYKLPIPKFKICNSEQEGINFISNQPASKWYIKASGLAAGKGAILATNKDQACSAINAMKNFGKAGKNYLIEEVLEGEEFSAFALVNNKSYNLIGYAQDHKKLNDGDLGPNTGGMGCSGTPYVISKKIDAQVKKIIKKTILGLASENRPYTGILYLGGIVDQSKNVKIIEYNARWGDPEAQVLIPGIKNDYINLIQSAMKGKIKKIRKNNSYRVAVTVSSRGYPGDIKKVFGKKISTINKLFEKTNVYGAGIKKLGDEWFISGGRLFYVTGEGATVHEARENAYRALSLLGNNQDIHYRKDIGWRDMLRNRKWSTQ